MTNSNFWDESGAVSGLVAVSGRHAEGVIVGKSIRAIYDTPDIYVVNCDWGLTVAWGGLARDLRAAGFSEGVIPLAFGPGSWLIGPDLSSGGSGNTVPSRQSQNAIPPFAAVEITSESVDAYVDSLGFRQLYYFRGAGWSGISTSALLLARLGKHSLNWDSVAVQSQLGWQVGNGTLFHGVQVIPQGGVVQMNHGLISESFPKKAGNQQTSICGDSPKAAAAILRECLSSQLEEFPDSVLQLTGGLDSRILLAAIPRDLRREVAAVTLDVPGSSDLRIARQLTRKFGMRHYVGDFPDCSKIAPEEVFDNCVQAARSLDCAVDPIGFAALKYAESSMPGGTRIAGLGGEYARGFYYFGFAEFGSATRSRVSALARWRMFPNESVARDMFSNDFAAEVEGRAIDLIYGTFDVSQRWWSSTDDFYLYQRMRRWAGSLATADCMHRRVVNPMLDPRFLQVARQTAPRDKRDMRLLSRILIELDPELAEVPLDGRPAPVKFAGGLSTTLASSAMVSKKVLRKAAQRFHGLKLPPVGASILSAKVVEHIRRNPETIEPLYDIDFLSHDWLEAVGRGAITPTPPAVSFLMNLVSACRFTRAI